MDLSFRSFLYLNLKEFSYALQNFVTFNKVEKKRKRKQVYSKLKFHQGHCCANTNRIF